MAWPTDISQYNEGPNDPDAVLGDVAREVHPRDHRILYEFMVDALAEMGANPSGIAADLTARLTSIETAAGNAVKIKDIPVVGIPTDGQRLVYRAADNKLVWADSGGAPPPPSGLFPSTSLLPSTSLVPSGG